MGLIDRIPNVASVLAVIVSFINITKGTTIEKFLRWLHLGGFLDFIYSNYVTLLTVFIIGIAFRWIRDIRILAVIGILFWLFVTYIL